MFNEAMRKIVLLIIAVLLLLLAGFAAWKLIPGDSMEPEPTPEDLGEPAAAADPDSLAWTEAPNIPWSPRDSHSAFVFKIKVIKIPVRVFFE